MADQWFWLVLAACEVLLVLVLLLSVAWMRGILARRRDRQAIKSLVAKTRKHRDQRVSKIAAFLGEQYGLAGDGLNAAVTALYKAEVGMIQAFATIYDQRDASAAAGFGARVETATGAYWALSASDQAHVEDVSAERGEHAEQDVTEGDGEVDRLRGENERLSDELRVTMDTMSRMLNEYSTVFSKDGDRAQITVVDDPKTPSDADAVVAETAAAADVPTDPDPGTAGAAAESSTISPDDALTDGGLDPEPAANTSDVTPDQSASTADDELADRGIEPDAAAPDAAAPAAPDPDDILADMGLEPESKPEPAPSAAEDEPARSASTADDVLADMGIEPDAVEPETAAPEAPDPDDILADMGLDPESEPEPTPDATEGGPAQSASTADDVLVDTDIEPEASAPSAPDPDDILADMGLAPETEPEPAPSATEGESAQSSLNADDVPVETDVASEKEAAEAGEAASGRSEDKGEGTDRFGIDLDEDDKDLSDDATGAPALTPAEKAAAERQRIIDADS